MNNIERYTNKLQNIYNNLDNQNVKFSLYIPYNSDDLKFESDGFVPFKKEKYYKLNRFNVEINNNNINVFHDRVNKYQKLTQFNRDTNNQTIYNIDRLTEQSSYKLTKYTNKEESYYLLWIRHILIMIILLTCVLLHRKIIN